MRKETDEGPCAGCVGRLGAQAPVRNQPGCTTSHLFLYRDTLQRAKLYYKGSLDLAAVSYIYGYISAHINT